MNFALDNAQMSANGATKGAGFASNRWQAPGRCMSAPGFTEHVLVLLNDSLPVRLGAGFGRRPFPFRPARGFTLKSPRCGGRQSVERLFSICRSALSVPHHQFRALHHGACKLSDAAPVVITHARLPLASEPSERGVAVEQEVVASGARSV